MVNGWKLAEYLWLCSLIWLRLSSNIYMLCEAEIPVICRADIMSLLVIAKQN